MTSFLNKTMQTNRIIFFFHCFVSLILCSCGNKEDSNGNEKYDQVIVPDTDNDESIDSVHIPQSKRTTSSQESISFSKLKFRYAGETEFVDCTITELIFDLIENPDKTIQLALKANGLVGEENGYKTNCYFYPTVPWTPDAPPTLPYSWVYSDTHLHSGTLAQYHSRTDTRLVLTRENLTDPSDHEVIYPVPGEIDDPPNAVIDGSTTLLIGTVANYNEDIEIWLTSSFIQTDQSGNTIEVQFELSPAASSSDDNIGEEK